jgi:putative transposase
MNKTKLAKDLSVSRATIYYKSTLEPKDEALKQEILDVVTTHPAYGHKRIAIHLHINKKRVLRVMKKYNITPIIKRRSKPKGSTPKSVHCTDWLNQLCPLTPNAIWASDFTYIHFQYHWWYVATVIDVYTREIIGIAMSRYHNQKLVYDALQDALTFRPPPQFIHADQGSEYTAEEYQQFVESTGITLSYSPKGSPWKNCYQESFYSNFKLELGSITDCKDSVELFERICTQIHYYNHKRIHTALQMAPVLFARQHFLRHEQVS